MDSLPEAREMFARHFPGVINNPIPVYKPLCDLGGSVISGLYISYLFEMCEGEEWFSFSRDEIENAIGMTRYEQERARAVFRERGILIEQKRGLPARVWTRFNLQALYETLMAGSPLLTERRRSCYGHGFVYLMTCRDIHKIGLAVNVERRRLQLEEAHGDTVEVLHTIPTENMRDLEKQWHQRFKKKHLYLEWFLLSPGEIAEFQAF